MSHNNEESITGIATGISEKIFNQKVAGLTDELSPERDLWPGIERAISQKNQQNFDTQSKSNVVPMAWAASFIVAILLSWLSFMPNSQQGVPVNIVQQPEIVQIPKKAGSLVTFMQENFQQQKKAVLVSFGQPNLTQLSPAMQTELKQLAAARKSIRQALLKDENNVDLLNLLDFTQQQELKLLTQLYQQLQVI